MSSNFTHVPPINLKFMKVPPTKSYSRSAPGNRRSLASTTEEHLSDFRSEKKTLELAITRSISMRFKRHEDMMRSTKGNLTRIYTETTTSQIEKHWRRRSGGVNQWDGVGVWTNGSNQVAFTQTVSDGEKSQTSPQRRRT